LGAAVWISLLIASRGFPLVWDEGYTFERQDALRPWLAELFDPAGRPWPKLFSKAVLDRHWRFSRAEPDGHGPFYALLSLAGLGATSWVLPPPVSYRVGSITLFSLAVATAYGTLRRRLSEGAGLVGALLLASCPRLVPEVCFALIDGPLASLSVLAFCAFLHATDRRSAAGAAGFGVAIGLATATKLTGWFLPIPYIAWTIWLGRRDGLRTLCIAAPVAAAILFAVNVGWWPNPVDGLIGFFRSNLTRDKTIPIATLFLGKVYPFSLPWYNTLVWMFFAAPAGALLLGSLGIVRSASTFFREPLGCLLVLNWGLIMAIRAMPQAPGHDGVRQLVVPLAFLCLLAGYGFDAISAWAADWSKPMLRRAAPAALGALAIVESVGADLLYHPQELSYYSPLVGGLPGATRLGMEPTYFWDSLTPDVLAWIDENTPDGQWVLFRNNPTSLDYMTRWGMLHAPHHPPPDGRPSTWIVYQHRPGIFVPSDRWLIENVAPAFQKKLLGVPVLSIYSSKDAAEAVRRSGTLPATKEAPAP
jgi:hypothetical protein